ncbi:MAG: DUF4976 domain-containing protein, partial [Bacteroidales bacterium]|nr:DUF4976 domain-containing protein [Bacteroidales bacterium]
LYDLENDPHEMHNVYYETANDRLIFDLKDKLKELQTLYKVSEASDSGASQSQ